MCRSLWPHSSGWLYLKINCGSLNSIGQIVANELFNEAVEKMLGMSLSKLSIEIGIETKEEAEKLSSDLGEILVGRFQD